MNSTDGLVITSVPNSGNFGAAAVFQFRHQTDPAPPPRPTGIFFDELSGNEGHVLQIGNLHGGAATFLLNGPSTRTIEIPAAPTLTLPAISNDGTCLFLNRPDSFSLVDPNTSENSICIGGQGINNLTNTVVVGDVGSNETVVRNSIFLGSQIFLEGSVIQDAVGIGSSASSHETIIGFQPLPDEGHTGTARCVIHGIATSDMTMSFSSKPVVVDDDGQLGWSSATPSSLSFKENIVPIQDSSVEPFFNMEPVSFTYKKDPLKEVRYGLIAEDVYKKIGSELGVVHLDDGQPKAINYGNMSIFLLKMVNILRKEVSELRELVSQKDV